MSSRREWLHDNERPSPGLTARLRPAAAPSIAVLRSATGTLVSGAQECADLMASHWAAVSRAPATHLEAQETVLASLSEAPRVSEADAAHLSCAEVTGAEVAAAMKRARSGTSPGPDGLPLEVYRRFKQIFLSLLARVFQAAIGDVLLPPGFQDGVIIFLAKAGEADASSPAGFRPITLLNTDYRLFARLLASRLGRALTPIIDKQQTAFLPDRCIGENIMLLQLLPHALRAQGRSAVAVFCDFRKAYDTIDRTFLWNVMARLGVGGAFLPVTEALLSNTRARAVVNGAMSRAVDFQAGVRQGCPLAPLYTSSLARP